MSIAANAVYGFVYFSLYHNFKELFRGHSNQEIMFFLSSILTQMISLCIYYPLDLIKV